MHKFYPIFSVANQIFHGKSLTRLLFNLALRQHSISGKILDIGSKNGKGSYYKYLNVDKRSEITHTDRIESDGVVSLNVEKKFPFPDESFDVVLAFHLFEHVYIYQVAPAEIFRILRKGGRVLIAMPFMHEYHADFDDYFRFTDSALLRLWEDVGFQSIHMEAIGEGILTKCATKLPVLIMPPWMRSWSSTLLYLLSTPFDRLISYRPRIDGKTVPERFALEHFAIFQKN